MASTVQCLTWDLLSIVQGAEEVCWFVVLACEVCIPVLLVHSQ